MGWLIFAAWGSASVFVVWMAAVSAADRLMERRRLGSGISEVDRLLAEAYPEIPPGS